MSIRAKNISIHRAGRKLLEDLQFSLNAGDALFVQGPNGSGKTSLLRALAGLGRMDGQLKINPDDTVYAGHLDAIKPALTGRENLQFWAEIYGLAGIPETLAPLDLAPLLNRDAKTLSAGQRRRLGLARIVMSGAKNWLLDEPITALDTQTVKTVESLIADHRAQGGIVIVTSHQSLALPKAIACNLTDYTPINAVDADPFLEGSF